jgi:hypothetical protein
MAKFKAGDRVRLINNLDNTSWSSYYRNADMGVTYVVKEVGNDYGTGDDLLKFEGVKNSCCASRFELVAAPATEKFPVGTRVVVSAPDALSRDRHVIKGDTGVVTKCVGPLLQVKLDGRYDTVAFYRAELTADPRFDVAPTPTKGLAQAATPAVPQAISSITISADKVNELVSDYLISKVSTEFARPILKVTKPSSTEFTVIFA